MAGFKSAETVGLNRALPSLGIHSHNQVFLVLLMASSGE